MRVLLIYGTKPEQSGNWFENRELNSFDFCVLHVVGTNSSETLLYICGLYLIIEVEGVFAIGFNLCID